MSVVTLRMPEDKHARLRMVARARGVSVNRLLDEVATVALAQHDAEVSFRARARRGRAKRARALALLARLDKRAQGSRASQRVLRAAAHARKRS